jgi:hypothetical protein
MQVDVSLGWFLSVERLVAGKPVIRGLSYLFFCSYCLIQNMQWHFITTWLCQTPLFSDRIDIDNQSIEAAIARRMMIRTYLEVFNNSLFINDD